MILHDNDQNCCILDFKCTKTKTMQCTHILPEKNPSKCECEYNGYCFNLLAQRELILEILYPDEAEITKQIKIKKDKAEDKKKHLELTTIGIGKK